MKIVLLIGGNSAPLNYFVNKINSQHKVDLVVVESPKEKKSNPVKSNKASSISFLEKAVNYLNFRLDSKRDVRVKERRQKEIEQYYEELFKGQHHFIDKSIRVLNVDNINSPETAKEIAKIHPDLLIDHGTSLVKNPIIDLAKRFDLKVVAEGIENEEALELLKSWGCDWGQGYHISRPVDPITLLTWLQENKDTQWFSGAV